MILEKERIHSEYIGRYEFANRKEWRNFYKHYLEYFPFNINNDITAYSHLKYLDIVAKFINDKIDNNGTVLDIYKYVEQLRTPEGTILWTYEEKTPIPGNITPEEELLFMFLATVNENNNSINYKYLPITSGELQNFPTPDYYFINGRKFTMDKIKEALL